MEKGRPGKLGHDKALINFDEKQIRAMPRKGFTKPERNR